MTDRHLGTTSSDPDVVVVGGGVAGLVAAAVAARAGARTTVLDAHRLGGRARVDDVGGYRFNRGPRALYVGGRAEQILGELGVPTTGARPPLRGGTALRDGRLHRLPHGPGSLARTTLLGPGEKARFARRLATLGRLDPTAFAGRSADQAIAELGLGPAGQEVVRGLVRVATYTAATDLLDGPTALAQVQMAVARGVRYLDGGWQPLVDGLAAAARAAGAEIHTGVAVRAVRPAGSGPHGRARSGDRAGAGDGVAVDAVGQTGADGAGLVVEAGDGTGVVIETGDGSRLRATTVVIAAGGPDAAAALLGGRPTGWEGLGPPATAACLELGLRQPPATRFVMGVGEPLYLSTHAPPADLAPEGGAVVHAMRYLRPDEEAAPDAIRAQLQGLAARAGVSPEDVVEERFLARMVVTGGVPTAGGGGRAGRPAVDATGAPGVLLAGDWVGPEGLLADTALASAVDAGRRAAARSATMAPA